MKNKIQVKVEIEVVEGYDVLNDGRGGLADIIRDGLNNPNYDYLKNIKILED